MIGKKFYFIALGSLRETQTIIEMIDFPKKADLQTMADNLGGQIYNLCRSLQRQGKKPTAHWP